MRKPNYNISIFKQRRQKVMEQIRGSVMIVASNHEELRSHDTCFPFRQDSNLFYLTAFEEPESFLVLKPGSFPESIMFVRQKNRERETWDGFRYGPEGTEKEFAIDKVYPIDELEKVLPQILKGAEKLYYRLCKNPQADTKIMEAVETCRLQSGRTGYGLLPIHDADELLGEMRLFKSAEEMHELRTACEITAQAHLAAMKFTKPGVTERQVQAVLTYEFLSRNSAREGYNFIIASGASATTLHYNFNDQTCKNGDLLLIDAGAEYNNYTGDITRTFPVNGRFTDEQAKVYEGVLKVQKQILASIKPGLPFKEMHSMADALLTDLMLDLGLLSGTKSDIIAALSHKKYYPHGIGHWLGLDVHDHGKYYLNGEPRGLQENMCFTVEPGLYIPADDESAPAKYRGIGVRIEDNVRVTTQGYEMLTGSVPKEISEIEKVVGIGWSPKQ